MKSKQKKSKSRYSVTSKSMMKSKQKKSKSRYSKKNSKNKRRRRKSTKRSSYRRRHERLFSDYHPIASTISHHDNSFTYLHNKPQFGCSFRHSASACGSDPNCEWTGLNCRRKPGVLHGIAYAGPHRE